MVVDESRRDILGSKPPHVLVDALKRLSLETVRGILELVFPRECPICEADSDDAPSLYSGLTNTPFCKSCRLELLEAAGPSCARCAMPIGPFADPAGPCRECVKHRFGFQGAFALGPYSGAIRDLILEMKHANGAWIAPWLAALLAEARPSLRELALKSPEMLVMPIPLHWKREWSRGYNQSDELARGLARSLGLKHASALKRVQSGGILPGMGRTQRAKALQNAFRLKRFAKSRIEGRTILLVDDVLTTGATAGSAARTLKRAGAARVALAVIGRAEGRSHS